MAPCLFQCCMQHLFNRFCRINRRQRRTSLVDENNNDVIPPGRGNRRSPDLSALERRLDEIFHATIRRQSPPSIESIPQSQLNQSNRMIRSSVARPMIQQGNLMPRSCLRKSAPRLTDILGDITPPPSPPPAFSSLRDSGEFEFPIPPPPPPFSLKCMTKIQDPNRLLTGQDFEQELQEALAKMKRHQRSSSLTAEPSFTPPQGLNTSTLSRSFDKTRQVMRSETMNVLSPKKVRFKDPLEMEEESDV